MSRLTNQSIDIGSLSPDKKNLGDSKGLQANSLGCRMLIFRNYVDFRDYVDCQHCVQMMVSLQAQPVRKIVNRLSTFNL